MESKWSNIKVKVNALTCWNKCKQLNLDKIVLVLLEFMLSDSIILLNSV